MLADVLKERERQRVRITAEDLAKYNKPYKRNVMVYFDHMYKLGGIQTWIKNIGKQWEITAVYDKGDEDRIKYLEDLGIETVKSVGQELECDTLLFTMFGNPGKFKARRKILFIHGDYSKLEVMEDIPEYDEIYAVSKSAAEGFYKRTGIMPKVCYNPLSIEEEPKPIVIGVFSRLSMEKGGKRIKYLAEKLKASGKPYLILIWTDLPMDIEDKNVVFFDSVMNPVPYMRMCTYVAVLSDTEACPYTPREALAVGVPLIITKLPMLEELGINESNAKILEFDMSNLDIDDLYNVPVVKDWKDADSSKEWGEIMKKAVFREKYTERDVQNVAKAIKDVAMEDNKTVEQVVNEMIEESKPKKKKKVK